MKRLKAVPDEIVDLIKKEQESSLQKILKGYMRYCTLPIRPTLMRVRRDMEDTTQLEQVIIPSTEIHIREDAFLDKDHLNRDSITYLVTGTNHPFPFGHIYQGSGHVCLGNIFVPSKVSKYSPQQPLETLFLHNDRNLSHGNASLKLSADQVNEVENILSGYGIERSIDVKVSFRQKKELLADDCIWLIGADVYRQRELEDALVIMHHIYGVVFPNKTRTLVEEKRG